MLNQIINTVLLTIPGSVQGIVLEQMLEQNNRRTSKWFRILYWALFPVFPSLVNAMIDGSRSTMPIQNVITITFCVIPVVFFYCDPVWRRIFAILLTYVGLVCTDFISIFIILSLDLDMMLIFDKSNPITVMLVAVSNFIAIGVIVLISIIWKKLLHKGRKMKYFSFFLIYVLQHIFTMIVMEIELIRLTVGYQGILPVISSTICEVVLIVIIFSQVEKEELEDKLSEEKRKGELEKIHYNEVKRRKEELEKISTSNYQEVLKIRELLKNQNVKQVEEELKAFLHNISGTREKYYCDIPIINVILSEKVQVCEAKNICLEIDIRLAGEVKMNQIDFCRILGNLLDNAIRACEQYETENETKTIQLSVVSKGEYIVIKCLNPVGDEVRELREGHGYGIKILKDIANRYQGDFRTEKSEHQFLAQMIVRG